ncbi:MAG TPA: undecaprenyl-diphosphatase UppP [Thermoleophilaceae bacterium]|nr:undecaprenyl-diphosphatase UppP [Thermoleophilaceae bacterium]
MHPLEALLLGVVQGLTEFLPISSSGHLILVPWLQDYHYLSAHPHFNKTFDVALHLGTLVAVLGYFRHEIIELIAGAWGVVRKRRAETAPERLAVVIAVACVPAAIVGAAFQDTIDEKLGDPWQIAILLAVFGLLLGFADRLPQRRDMETVNVRDALKIGAAQAISLAPGVSRSGITITAGRALGLDRDSAARFSFLLLAPITAGAVVVKGAGVAKDGLPAGALGPMIVGIVAAAVTGYLTIAWMLAYVRRRSYDVFVIYRLAAALVVALVILTGLRPATF